MSVKSNNIAPSVAGQATYAAKLMQHKLAVKAAKYDALIERLAAFERAGCTTVTITMELEGRKVLNVRGQDVLGELTEQEAAAQVRERAEAAAKAAAENRAVYRLGKSVQDLTPSELSLVRMSRKEYAATEWHKRHPLGFEMKPDGKIIPVTAERKAELERTKKGAPPFKKGQKSACKGAAPPSEEEEEE